MRKLCVCVVVALLACAKAEPKRSDTVADLELAGRVSATPQLKDVANPVTAQQEPAAPAPAQAAPAPKRAATKAPKAPEPVAETPAPQAAAAPAPAPTPMLQIGRGAQLVLRVSAAVCDNNAKPGDEILATLDQDVVGANDARLAAGTTATLRITQVNASQDTTNTQPFTMRPGSIRWDGAPLPLEADVRSTQVERVKRPVSKSTIVKGAIGGAVLGLLAGRNKKAVIEGAAAGTAVGAGVAVAKRDYDLCIPSGGTIVLTLQSALVKTP